MRRYHDDEWGVPVRTRNELFERLTLEAFQSGLSWLTVLRKRERFREVFAGFDVESVAAFDAADVSRLLTDLAATTPESQAMAKELKRRGLRFVGPTTAYALMQATGMVDDHLVGCWARRS